MRDLCFKKYIFYLLWETPVFPWTIPKLFNLHCFELCTNGVMLFAFFLSVHVIYLFFLLLLYNIVLILPYINMNLPWVYMCSQSWTPLPPSSPYHPSGSSQSPAPSILYPASNLDWQFVSYMILYMFQCHSPKSLHPLPLSQSPKDCSIYLCFFCLLAYRVIVTIFLNSNAYICISILYWCFSFWLTSLCIIGSSFIHLIRTDSNVFFLRAE